jgi:hypothetical protein
LSTGNTSLARSFSNSGAGLRTRFTRTVPWGEPSVRHSSRSEG